MEIDLTRNHKQRKFYQTAIACAKGLKPYRHLFYGGAVRGGKTFVSLAILVTLARYFSGFRSHVIRQDFPALQGTSIPSLEKILHGQSNWKWNRDKSNFFAYHTKSDGKIFFKAENYDRDPNLNDFLGLETNAFLFEQIEELQKKTFEIANSRNGSWYIDPMPAPLALATFNPTQTWIKEHIYEPWRDGKLKEHEYLELALPSDNPFVTDEQWKQWNNLAERYRLQFIEGDWTNFDDTNNRWAFAFDRTKHLGTPEPDWQYTLNLSFDFNKNPICCSIIQHIDNQVRVLETVKLSNSDIYSLCDYINTYYPNYIYKVTGDASGSSTTALVRDNLNFYIVIKEKLQLNDNQLLVPSVNPRLEENQVLVNSMLANYNIVIHQEKAKGLIYDLQNVKTYPDGTIVKANREDPTQQADALDTFRYYLNTFHGDFLRIPTR